KSLRKNITKTKTTTNTVVGVEKNFKITRQKPCHPPIYIMKRFLLLNGDGRNFDGGVSYCAGEFLAG
ncbi:MULTISPECIES: hypothetical protein, partial [Bacillus cereus group]|uniref:hypothetical protein n=1 Tax=Bacillus cereus group TaxID=86661 RepID=UPI001C3E937D